MRVIELRAENVKEKDFQCWIEIVGDGDGSAVVIEDGSVVA